MSVGRWGPCVTAHTALIHDRGGVRRIAQLQEVSEVRWGRTLSDAATATVVVRGKQCVMQSEDLLKIRSKRHELVLYRGDGRSFEGPIEEVAWFPDRVEIRAKDVTGYLQGTVLSKAWPNADGGGSSLMTTRVSQIINYELTTPYSARVGTGGAAQTIVMPRWETLTDPANILPYLDVRASSTLLTRSDTSAFELTVFEHLKNLAEGGLDFTTVGRSIIAWDSAVSLGQTRTVTEKDFTGELQLYESGTEHASIAHISATPNEDTPSAAAFGSAGDEDDYYGVWTALVTRADEQGSDTPTQDELNTQAQRSLRGRRGVPLEIVVPSGASVILNDTLQMRDLVVGAIMPVRLTANLRPVSQDQRIEKVEVTETSAGEKIALTLAPWGEVVVV